MKVHKLMDFVRHLYFGRIYRPSSYIHIYELIFQKVATEIEHILRLSKLKEYASH